MHIKYLFWIFVIILFFANCESSPLIKKEEEDTSDEFDDDNLNIEITKQTTQILGRIYAAFNVSDDENSVNDMITISRSLKKRSIIQNQSLYQGDIVLTQIEAVELIAEAKKVAKENHVNIESIETEIKNLEKSLAYSCNLVENKEECDK
uniref:Lipoprotein n=1 Tax=Strongyloides papillosus TaxID=174720 RepID=A0A0N5CE33_STREA